MKLSLRRITKNGYSKNLKSERGKQNLTEKDNLCAKKSQTALCINPSPPTFHRHAMQNDLLFYREPGRILATASLQIGLHGNLQTLG